MLAHESCALSYLRYGRVGEGVEEVVLCQDKLALNALRVDVFVWLESLLKLVIGSCRDAPSGKSKLRGCGTLGGVISLRWNILRKRSERLGWSDWHT